MLYFYESILHVAVKKRNIDIVKLLLTKENLDINIFQKIWFEYFLFSCK